MGLLDVQTCPHCGSFMFDKPIFPPVKQKIFDYLRKHHKRGVTSEELYAHIWGWDPNGGPDSNALSVHLTQMKPTLCKLNPPLRISATGGPGSRYYLIEVPSDANV